MHNNREKDTRVYRDCHQTRIETAMSIRHSVGEYFHAGETCRRSVQDIRMVITGCASMIGCANGEDLQIVALDIRVVSQYIQDIAVASFPNTQFPIIHGDGCVIDPIDSDCDYSAITQQTIRDRINKGLEGLFANAQRFELTIGVVVESAIPIASQKAD